MYFLKICLYKSFPWIIELLETFPWIIQTERKDELNLQRRKSLLNG